NETYSIVQADIDAGSKSNIVTASGTDPVGEVVSGSAGYIISAIQNSGISVTKTALPASFSNVGDVIVYTIEVENTGNVTLSNISVSDPMTGLNTAIDSLPPGANQSFNQNYTIRQVDINAGRISNTVTVSGRDPSGETVTGNARADVNASQNAD